ncbi:family drug resistance transporter [Lichtheimia corymbifera JMRC:FSU:9682]|uniref:Family drug resistance transporter n=1 Tax=Lichtheimia corymbifera JMRC:FSU:9682 TaxID=1263082 RepID=A0A068RM89_9FUNG|nr:family drug resistance transporter [Lichtheimia corymbifera JMRC:FSU:9682]
MHDMSRHSDYDDQAETNTIVDEVQTIHEEQGVSKFEKEKEFDSKSFEEAQPSRWDNVKRVVVMFGIILALFMVSLNTTVIAPAMSIIATDMDAPDEQTWIATAYLLAFNSSQPLSGKPVLMFGILVFFVGCLVNATTPQMMGLIAGRTVQGLGGGCVMTMSYVIVADLAPLKWRPRFQSGLTVVYGLASVVGTLIGGVFVDQLTWRWDFWLNVILAGTSFIIVIFLLKEPTKVAESSLLTKLRRIDWLGTVFVIGFVCCILLALSWGQSYGWGSGHAIGSFVAAGVSLVLLIIVEGWVAKEPLFPRDVILNPAVVLFYLYIICLGFCFIGTLYYGPILYQSVFGADSMGSGVRLVPYMAMLIVASLSSGYLLPIFPYIKAFIGLGAITNIIGYGLFYTVGLNSSWAQQSCYLMLCGFAFGLSQQNTIMGAQSAADKKYIAIATGLTNFFMIFACSIGVAIYQTLFVQFLRYQLTKVDTNILAIAAKYGATSNYLYIRNMPDDAQPEIISAYMRAMHSLFIFPLVAAGVAVICAAICKNTRYGASDAKAAKEENHIVVPREKEEV